jgi:hypothetical protein
MIAQYAARKTILAQDDAVSARPSVCDALGRWTKLIGMKTGKEGSRNAAKLPTVSRCYPDGTLVELVYQPENNSTAFAIWRSNSWTIEAEIEISGERLIPFSPGNNLISTGAVLLPSAPVDYGSEQDLISSVQAFIHRYADLSPTFESVATHYVLLSWLYDAFSELPYLRLRGDFGTGKTRTLLTIGSICNKGFFASGASTVSPLFHTLNAFRGTLIFDEADFRFSDEKAELVKILNNGNVKGLPVLRTVVSREREFNPKAFQVFGPKIVASRGAYEDRGLESRFLTEEMGVRPLRQDIPINTPACFAEEALELRNKLLLYRFHQQSSTKLDDSLLDPSLEPRVNQVLLPLLSIVRDRDLHAQFRTLASRTQSILAAERGNSLEGQILEVLAELIVEPERSSVSIGEIAVQFAARHGADYERPVTNRQISGVLRRRLNIQAYKSHGVYVVPIGQRAKVGILAHRYGINAADIKDPEVQSGEMGTQGTF